jgi:integrase
MTRHSGGKVAGSAIRSLPFAEWPKGDRLAWMAACRPVQRLARGGSAGHLAAVTQADLARRYGYLLDFLDRSGGLDRTAEAADQVTPKAIAAFITELEARVSSVTVSRTIYKIRRAAESIAPHRDFAWLAEIEKDLVVLERPKNDLDRIVTTELLVEAGLTLIREAEADSNGSRLRRSLLVRNGLMVALLALCPIRLKNFAALDLGDSFLRLESGWWIVLEDTKSKRPDHRPVPPFLTSAIASYLTVHRPVLLSQKSDSNEARFDTVHKREPMPSALWSGRLGAPLSYGQVEHAITETTRLTLGVPVNPHRFRACAATSAALYAASPHFASALLQHSDFRITEENYYRASSLSVARDFASLVRGL